MKKGLEGKILKEIDKLRKDSTKDKLHLEGKILTQITAIDILIKAKLGELSMESSRIDRLYEMNDTMKEE